MTPQALAACGEGASKQIPSFQAQPDPGLPPYEGDKHLYRRHQSAVDHAGGAATLSVTPSQPSCLYNSMIAPWEQVGGGLKAFLWYQGEANSGNPVGYGRCFPAFIADWRTHFGAGPDAPNTSFIFAQLASWPDGDTGAIANTRWAQQKALALPNVGMAVAADRGDPSSAFHCIHPPWKQPVGYRASLPMRRYAYGDKTATAAGPLPLTITLDVWNPSWGNYHLG